jgi:hypothetical protein
VPDVVERFLTAMVAHEWETMGACVADDVHRVGPYGDVYDGRDAYVAFIADQLPRLPGYRMDVDRVVYAGSVAVAELSETVDVRQLDGGAQRLRTPEALVFDLNDDGLIARIQVFTQTLP